MKTDSTTLISLFHSEEQATQAISDLHGAGIPASQIHQASGTGNPLSSLQPFELSSEDRQLLADGIRSGGSVIVISDANESIAGKAEEIFRKHHAGEVNEHTLGNRPKLAADSEMAIPVIEEELLVGKRAVQSGGVRVFSRIVSTPVSQNVTLTEEHATIQRRPVNREATEADFTSGDKVIEVVNRDEEAVVTKTARVVEEVSIGKESSKRTEKVSDTVRKTEIDVERLTGDEVKRTGAKKS